MEPFIFSSIKQSCFSISLMSCCIMFRLLPIATALIWSIACTQLPWKQDHSSFSSTFGHPGPSFSFVWVSWSKIFTWALDRIPHHGQCQLFDEKIRQRERCMIMKQPPWLPVHSCQDTPLLPSLTITISKSLTLRKKAYCPFHLPNHNRPSRKVRETHLDLEPSWVWRGVGELGSCVNGNSPITSGLLVPSFIMTAPLGDG